MMGSLAFLAPSSWNPSGYKSVSLSGISGEKKKTWGTHSGNWYKQATLGPNNGINYLLQFFSVLRSATLLPLGRYSGSSLQQNSKF